MRTLRKATFDDWIRAASFVGTLLAVIWLATFGDDRVKLLAAGALFTLLGNAQSYMFKAKLAVTSDTEPTATIVQKPPG